MLNVEITASDLIRAKTVSPGRVEATGQTDV